MAERNSKARQLREQLTTMREAAKRYQFSYHRLLKFRALNPMRFRAIMWLLTANIRSGFKKSMRDQVISWLNDPAPKYPTPLSSKQFDYIQVS